MTIAQALAAFSTQLEDALRQHTEQLAEAKTAAQHAGSQFTVAQIAAGSLGTQIDEAEKRVMRRIDGLERRIDALLRERGLDPRDFDE